MTTLIFLVGWCILFVLCWPLALVKGILFLPARMLGYRG